jgi:hypothetical protein
MAHASLCTESTVDQGYCRHLCSRCATCAAQSLRIQCDASNTLHKHRTEHALFFQHVSLAIWLAILYSKDSNGSGSLVGQGSTKTWNPQHMALFGLTRCIPNSHHTVHMLCAHTTQALLFEPVVTVVQIHLVHEGSCRGARGLPSISNSAIEQNGMCILDHHELSYQEPAV